MKPLIPWAMLEWNDPARLDLVEGAAEVVFGARGATLRGLPLAAALGMSEEAAAQLHRTALEEASAVEFVGYSLGKAPTVLRLALGHEGQRALAAVVDVGALLDGAPPVQISRLSSSLSHEIRNPLSSVKMAVQTLARNTGLSERDQRRLVIANREVRTMERMLWLFSEYGRESASHGELAPLRGLVLEAAGMVELELAERRVRVEVEETAPCPKVRLDLARLRPVLAQLLLNVAMGQSEDSVVKVAITPEEGWTKLLVTDPQVVPPEEQATVFEPFGSLLARGAGLSLAALSRVMKSHGGRVTADSGAGPGTVYTLCFPAAA